MQITVDNSFAQGMQTGSNAYLEGARLQEQKRLDDANIGETQTRTQGMGIANKAAQSVYDQQQQVRGLNNSIAADTLQDPNNPTPAPATVPDTPGGQAPSVQPPPPAPQAGQGSGPTQVGGDPSAQGAAGLARTISTPAPQGAAAAIGTTGASPAPGLAPAGSAAAPPPAAPAPSGASQAPGMAPSGSAPTTLGEAQGEATAQQRAQTARKIAALSAMRGDSPADQTAAQTAAQQAQASLESAHVSAAIAKNPALMQPYLDQLAHAHPELNFTVGKDANGYPVMTKTDPNDPTKTTTQPITHAAVMNLINGEIYMRHGLTQTGMGMISAADGDVADSATRLMNGNKDVASTGTTARADQNLYVVGKEEADARLGAVGVESKRLAMEGSKNTIQMQDAQGGIHLMTPTPDGNGGFSYVEQKAPAGLVPAKEVDTKAMTDYSTVHQIDKGADGKPIGPLAAAAQFRQMVTGTGGSAPALPHAAPPPGGPGAAPQGGMAPRAPRQVTGAYTKPTGQAAYVGRGDSTRGTVSAVGSRGAIKYVVDGLDGQSFDNQQQAQNAALSAGLTPK